MSENEEKPCDLAELANTRKRQRFCRRVKLFLCALCIVVAHPMVYMALELKMGPSTDSTMAALWLVSSMDFPLGWSYSLFEPLLPVVAGNECIRAPAFTMLIFFPIVGLMNWLVLWWLFFKWLQAMCIEQPDGRMRYSLPKVLRTFGYTLLILIIAAMSLFFWQFRDTPLVVSPETTLIDQPRTADGKYVDYLGYIRGNDPPEMNTEENGAYCLTRDVTFELSKDAKEPSDVAVRNVKTATESRRRFLDAFKLNTDASPKHKLVVSPVIFKYTEHGAKADTSEEKSETRWLPMGGEEYYPEKDYFLRHPELVQEFVVANSSTLDCFAAALQKKVFRFPVVNFWGVQDETLTADVMKRDLYINAKGEETLYFVMLCNSLCIRIEYRLGMGAFDGALDDLTALASLCRDPKTDAIQPWSYRRVWLCAWIQRCSLTKIDKYKPTVEQQKRLAGIVAALWNPMPTLQRAACAKRLDMIQLLAARELSFQDCLCYEPPAIVPYLERFGIDWNETARMTIEGKAAEDLFCLDETRPFGGIILKLDMILLTRKGRGRLLGFCLCPNIKNHLNPDPEYP